MTPYEPSVFYYTFGPHPPALRVQPHESVETWTADSGNRDPQGRVIASERRQPGAGQLEGNPVTGPFAIEGAEPGDTLVVHWEAIELNRDDAFGAVQAHLGVLGDDLRFVGPTGLKPPVVGRRYDWQLDHDSGSGCLALPRSRVGSVRIPLHPFLGCVGVAPRWCQAIHTVDAGTHGGNLDCLEIRTGTQLHLPVSVSGALLMFGDAHAAQGDGELAGGALETTARVRFHCEVLKGRSIRWPRIVTDDAVLTVASGRPLIDVLRIAWVEMILWLQSEFGYDRWDALHVLSQTCRVRVCNAVSPSYTAIVSFPRSYCPPPQYTPDTDTDLFAVPAYPPRP